MSQNKRTAMVTGANSGVGFELTKKLLSQNWDVIALIRSAFPGKEMIIQKATSDGRLRIYKADISDFQSLESALGHVKKMNTVSMFFSIMPALGLENLSTHRKAGSCITKLIQ